MVAVATALMVLGACGDDDGDEDVQTGNVDEVPVLDVELGDEPVCMDMPEDQGQEVEDLPLIDCAEPHSHELYAMVRYEQAEDEESSDLYPGEAELETFSEGACLTEFEPFVGISFFDSELYFSWIIPSLDGWNDEDDRDVLCVLGRFDSSKMEGTAEGSAR